MGKQPNISTGMLPPLPSIIEVQERLAIIFPESFPDRGILVGVMAARVVFVFLYGGFIEGHNRYLRPSHVYLFTKEQSQKDTDEDRGAPAFRKNFSQLAINSFVWFRTEPDLLVILSTANRNDMDPFVA